MKKFTPFLAAVIGLGAVSAAHAGEPTWQFMTTGQYSTYGIKTDGTLWAWGSAEYGELGNGSKTPGKVSTPTQVGTDTDWKYIGAGSCRAFFIKEDGTLWSTGTAEGGVLGTGSTEAALVPAQIGTDTDWAMVSSSIQGDNYAAMAIKTDGTLWGWGKSEYGEIGSGAYNTYATPVQIGTDTDWAEVSMGHSHSLAIKSDGSIYGCGNGSNGALGASNPSFCKSWVKVADADNWKHVYAIEDASYAVKADGSLWAWGSNYRDLLGLQLNEGENEVASIDTPTRVSAISEPVIKISGSQYVRAVLAGDDASTKVYTWGYDYSGELGNGTGSDFGDVDALTIYTTPQSVVFDNGVLLTDLSCGQNFVVVQTSDGKLLGWGSNNWGQLGTSEPENMLGQYKTTPIEVAAAAEAVDPGAEFDAENIPSSLNGVEKITLIGEWGTEDLAKLITPIGNGQGIMGFTYNETLKTVDMSKATFKENTSLEKVLRNCSVLETVIMPENDSKANLVSLNNAFMNDKMLSTIDVSDLINVTDLTQAFQNCKLIESLDLSKWTGVTTSDMAFQNCDALASIVLPGSFEIGDRCFGGDLALRLIDWSKYEGSTAPVIEVTDKYEPFYGVDFVPSDKAKVTVIVPFAAYESFSTDSYWSGFTIVMADEPGTYTVDAEAIPETLSDATKIILTGVWNTEKFAALAKALGTASGITASNSVLVAIDMSNAEIAEGTKLTMSVPGAFFGTSEKGVFQNFTALETVIMPAADQAANFTSLVQAFQGCSALKEIDLSGCTGLTKTNSAFYGCSSLEKVTLSKNFPLNSEVFDRCTSLKTIDWSSYEGTEAPTYSSSAMPTLDNSKDLTVIVPAAAYESFVASAAWNVYTITSAGSSGIVDIVAAEAVDTVRPVYDLTGRRVATLAPGEDASSLPAGLYIIAGKKILVK